MGFALFALIVPLQERMMSFQHRLRLRSMVWTEQRAKILLEVLGRYHLASLTIHGETLIGEFRGDACSQILFLRGAFSAK